MARLATLLALTLVLGAAAPVAAAERSRVVTYAVGVQDVPRSELARFRAVVGATLADPRGWSLGGRLRFKEVRRGARVTIRLTTPAVIASHGGCSAYFSCAPGPVLINVERWRRATASYPGAALRHEYRQMVINHEVGHVLGFGHPGCPGPGRPAPVMQQQSKGLGGCRRNPWPLAAERQAVAGREGVRAARPAAPLAVAARAGHVPLGAARATVRARLGAPLRREADGAVERYGRPALQVRYRDGHVVAVSTRAADDVDARGIGVGARLRAVERALRVTCDARRCVHRRGARETTFVLRRGRVRAVRLELLGASVAAAAYAGGGGRPAVD